MLPEKRWLSSSPPDPFPGARARITLVDRGLSHVWKPTLHTFAVGTHRPARQRIGYLGLAARNGFSFWPGVLQGVDRVRRRILLAPDQALAPALPASRGAPDILEYDQLILAIGSRASDFGTPGVAEHCLTIDDAAGAQLFRSHLRRHVYTSLLAGGPLRIVIVGGGPTGVELAAELKSALEVISVHGEPSLTRQLKLTLVDQGKRLLGTFPKSISTAAELALRRLGVDVQLGVGVAAADAQGLSLAGGGRGDADLRVWAAEGLEFGRSGQIKIAPTLEATVDPVIFALGDCAFLEDPVTGRGLPATALVAHQQATHLARGLISDDVRPLRPFRYRDLGSIVALGDFAGWGAVGGYTFGGGHLQGLPAKWVHDLLYRQHQLQTHGLLRGCLAWAGDELDRAATSGVELDA